MATINLGRIKPVFRGAYSGATAYVVDDIVTHGNESFICIQAHGAGTQATSVTAYWTKLAAKGTDGTDVGTTITTQGDILYRDGSGLQRLAKPASDKVLQNTSGGVLTWETAASGAILQVKQFRKLSTINDNSASDTVLAAPFDGSATITPAATANYIRCEYITTGDHGSTWRSGHHRLEWSADGGTTYYGLSGGASSANNSSNMQGNGFMLGGMFNPNVTVAVKVRVIINGHSSGALAKHGQYNNQGSDGSSTTPDTTNGVVAVGHYLILTELVGSLCTTADTA